LCFFKGESIANLALKDQLTALRWIKSQVSSFGGDPNKVTIFGISSSAATVALHMMNPSATGLFHGAIIYAGSPTAPFAYYEASQQAVAKEVYARWVVKSERD